MVMCHFFLKKMNIFTSLKLVKNTLWNVFLRTQYWSKVIHSSLQIPRRGNDMNEWWKGNHAYHHKMHKRWNDTSEEEQTTPRTTPRSEIGSNDVNMTLLEIGFV
jgi:hypothetical protein